MVLTRIQAENRSKCFAPDKYIQYSLFLELLQGKRYRGILIIEFELIETAGLTLDWQGEKINQIHTNTLGESESANNLIHLNNVQVGVNQVIIQFENDYSTSGHGLHSFVDADGLQYVYSQLEPHHASEFFPCFDQPDLKAQLKLTTQQSNQWVTISNEQQEQEVTNLEVVQAKGFLLEKEGYTYTQFKKTLPLSTYLFAVLSGPYKEIKAEKLHNNIPMSLYCRSSLLKYLEKESDYIFNVIVKGLEYYENLFQYKYPFSKYDQIFCPEYSSGAMENAGAVTVNDSYIFKESVPKSAIADRDNTLLHELSHMWFGDLVTMKWWDDLWLNESFAEFISHLCQVNTQGYVDHWVQFFERKVWGYVEDQMQTTHPIYCDVQNTDQAENIFDGITYAKGAGLLKQLYFMMGEKAFSQAMGQYFKQFAFKNTTLNDFFTYMKAAFPGDFLDQWQQDWIKKAGLNLVSYAVDGNKVTITQTATLVEHPTIRSQIFKVGVFDQDGKLLKVEQVQMKDVTQIDIDNQILVLNYNDESFLKTSYTQEQSTNLLKIISKIEPSLNRIVVLRSIWDQVRDGNLCLQLFIDGVVPHLLIETDDTVSKMVLSWLYGGVSFYTPRKYRQHLYSQLANLVIDLLRKTDPANKNRVLVLKKYLANWGVSKEHVELLKPYLESDELEFGFIGLQNGWTIINRVYTKLDLPQEEKQRLFDIWALKDGSDEVGLHKRFLESLGKTSWDQFTKDDKQESVRMISQVMHAHNSDSQAEQRALDEDVFFDALPQVFGQFNNDYAKAFYTSLYPINDNIEKYIKKAEKLLETCQHDILKQELKQSIDQDKRRLKTYKVYEQYIQNK